jgi:hypothetical protein
LGKNLRPEHLTFFRTRMEEHDRVMSVETIASQLEYLYIVHRTSRLPDVSVHLTDVYEYSELDYVARPKELKRNSFIVIALPHAHDVTEALVERAQSDRIGIGKIGKFMGALSKRDVWDYETPQEREDRERRARRSRQ